jgi:hypothetical protein
MLGKEWASVQCRTCLAVLQTLEDINLKLVCEVMKRMQQEHCAGSSAPPPPALPAGPDVHWCEAIQWYCTEQSWAGCG